ncbi:unnamed protein product, partial [Adineta steineri]
MLNTFDSQLKSILQPLSYSGDTNNGDPVLAAVQANDENTLRILIRAGYSINTIDPLNGRSLLHTATYLGHTEIVRRLLKEEVNTSLYDRDGKTSLHVAAAYGYSQILTLLLNYETHVEHLDYDNNTPLHMSCKFGHNECCRLLIYAGANLNPINRDGDTPLHSAIRYKHAGCTAILIHADASLNIRNGRYELPIELARRLGHHKIYTIILHCLSLSSQSNSSEQISIPNSSITLSEFEQQWRQFHLLIQTRMLANQHQLEEQIDSIRDVLDKNQLKQSVIHRKLQTLTNLCMQQNQQAYQIINVRQILLLFYIFNTIAYASDQKKPRARDLGIPFNGIPGKYNSIIDVQGVEVGFSTIIKGDSIRTGVTAIFPRGASKVLQNQPCFANWFSLNGNGEMTGIHWITESGFLTTPILITNTNSIGICHDSLFKWYLTRNVSTPMVNINNVSLPVVAETYDGLLNDINGFHVKQEHVFEALDNGKGSDSIIPEGNVGGGTGMISFGFKAGTGTSSRFIENLNYTVGVLVQSNFGRKYQLIIAGVPVGEEILKIEKNNTMVPDKDMGSIIVIIATDAPLLPHQLKRLTHRASLGIGKLGGIGGDSSGDIFLAFSTVDILDKTSTTKTVEFLLSDEINPLFEATIQCVEEAIVNAMVAAETMIGHNGFKVDAISHDTLIKIL